jgi:hypothetical protein
VEFKRAELEKGQTEIKIDKAVVTKTKMKLKGLQNLHMPKIGSYNL